jgi:hypothetical protein
MGGRILTQVTPESILNWMANDAVARNGCAGVPRTSRNPEDCWDERGSRIDREEESSSRSEVLSSSLPSDQIHGAFGESRGFVQDAMTPSLSFMKTIDTRNRRD